MLHVENLIQQYYAGFAHKHQRLTPLLVNLLKVLLHQKRLAAFQDHNPNTSGMAFVEKVIQYFELGYNACPSELANIPRTGPVVIAANHPIGTLDGLVLLKLISTIRPDVKVVANQLLSSIEPLRPLLFPVDNMTAATRKQQVKEIKQFMVAGGAMIVFPSGEVSRLGVKGIRDSKWNPGFLRFAAAEQAPILPVYIDGRNSIFFYALSLLAKPISTLWLVREMFKHSHNHFTVRIAEPVPFQAYHAPGRVAIDKAEGFRRQVYQLARRSSPATSYKRVAPPVQRKALARHVQQTQLLKTMRDGMEVRVFECKDLKSPLLREIGRLREYTFRMVGEGIGEAEDMDQYDTYYQHIFLWDSSASEVAGSYRIVDSAELLKRHNTDKLYCASLFDFSPASLPFLERGIELGRSFIQPKYQGSRALDYLWQGIGAVVETKPECRYLYGAVSLSAHYGDNAIASITRHYTHYYGDSSGSVTAKTPYLAAVNNDYSAIAQGDSESADFARLKRILSDAGLSVPTLYKQYSDLCEPGGVRFMSYSVDASFGNCIDAFVLVDIEQLRAKKQARYFPNRRPQNAFSVETAHCM